MPHDTGMRVSMMKRLAESPRRLRANDRRLAETPARKTRRLRHALPAAEQLPRTSLGKSIPRRGGGY